MKRLWLELRQKVWWRGWFRKAARRSGTTRRVCTGRSTNSGSAAKGRPEAVCSVSVCGPAGMSDPGDSIQPMAFQPDTEQARVLDHGRGPLLVTGAPGTGKTCVLRERFARLIEEGVDPERVVLVVRTGAARNDARAFLYHRLEASLPGVKVSTVHGLANQVVVTRFGSLGYAQPPDVLTAADQFSKVQELLAGEDHADWPSFASMLSLRGFADEVRQFVLRAQEALLSPEDILSAIERGAPGAYNIAEPSPHATIEKAQRELGWDPNFRAT